MTHPAPPYRLAAATALAVLAVYLVTLAPTVTFWDAGELLTAAKTLGIPHPPGSPLYVLLAHAWGTLLPLGDFGWRINLLSAASSAAAAGFWFLVAHDTIARLHSEVDTDSRRALARLGGVAAAVLASFTFTSWQNATGAEVYSTAMLAIAAIAWIATRWRALRSGSRGSRLLLVALYLCALSTGTHMMGMLVGPALLCCLALEARRLPLLDSARAEAEWSRIGVVAAWWVASVAIGLGNANIAIVAAVLVAAAAWRAVQARELAFAIAAGVVVLAGVSTVTFMLLRANQHPWLNSGTPGSWPGVLDMLRRTQYPVRTPFDDPNVMHGAGNPGRTFTLLGYQVANYAQYFDWQWAAGLGDLARKSYLRVAVTLLMFTLGLRGAMSHRRADRPSFGLVAALFLVAGPGLILYLDFRPGPSIGWNLWPALGQHEVRDRDYFFVASFVAWGLWVAIGLADIARRWIPRVTVRYRPAMAALFAVAIVPVAGNAPAATRRQTPEATLARDFARALLQSVPDSAVLFTHGDNDTFPLWYAQQVDGVRPDVTIICLVMAQSPSYIAELRRLQRVRPELPDTLRPFRAARGLVLPLDGHREIRIASGVVVTPSDVMVTEVLRMNAGHRPVAWSITAADNLFGLENELVQQGLALVLPVARRDSSTVAGGAATGSAGVELDVAATRRMIYSWSFGRLESRGPSALDANIQAIAATIATPITQTGIALARAGDTLGAVALLRRSVRLAGDSTARDALQRLEH